VALAQAGLLPGFPLGLQERQLLARDRPHAGQPVQRRLRDRERRHAALAEQRLMANLASGNAYFNIHSTTFGGGEIRAFVTAVPEPQTYALMAGRPWARWRPDLPPPAGTLSCADAGHAGRRRAQASSSSARSCAALKSSAPV
jgi:hypothetical protein